MLKLYDQTRQVIIASEKVEKRARIKRALAILFQQRGEKVNWIEASAPDEAVAAVDEALSLMGEVTQSLEMVIATSGLNGKWFEATGYARLMAENAVKAILMGGTELDVKEAKAAGIESVAMTVSEREIAQLAGQILFGELQGRSAAVGNSTEPVYETFEEAP